MAESKRTNRDLEPHPLVAALQPDPKKPPTRTVKLFGFPGKAADAATTRLWLDADLVNYVDIPTSAVHYSTTLPDDGGSILWVALDAQLAYGSMGGSGASADFLSGSIASQQFGGLPPGGPTPVPPTVLGPCPSLPCPTQLLVCHTIRCPSLPTHCPSTTLVCASIICPTRPAVCQTLPGNCPSIYQCPSHQIICHTHPAVCQSIVLTCGSHNLLCPSSPVVCQHSVLACPTKFCPSTDVPCLSAPCPTAACPSIACGGPGGFGGGL
jgi:hypothetical protein